MRRAITVGVPFFRDEPEALHETVKSLLDPGVELIVVDNGLPDESRSKLFDFRSALVEVIHNSENVYVNPAWNQIAETFLKTRSDLLIIANSDVLLAPGWAEHLERAVGDARNDRFWVGRLVARQEELSASGHESVEDALAWAPGGSWGAFFVLQRREVERVFPIPHELKLHLGDNWVFDFLVRTDMRAQIVNGVRLWHAGARGMDQLGARAHELTAKDRALWSNSFAHTCMRAADAAQRGRKMDELEVKYALYRDTPFDINEHLPTLRAYAAGCDHVTEFGFGRSTVALAHARPRVLKCYDPNPHDMVRADVAEVARLAEAAGIHFAQSTENDLAITIEETDLLFIDTIHTHAQLSAELTRHAPNVRKYILMHDTETFSEAGEDGSRPGLQTAIDEFLAAHREWEMVDRFRNNNGLTILWRTPTEDSRTAEERPIFVGVPVFREDSEVLRRALASLRAIAITAPPDPLVQVLAVDNGASEECKAVLAAFERNYSAAQFRVLHNPENIYVNGAWNQIAEEFLASDADLLAIVNADAELSEGWAGELWARSQQDESAYWRAGETAEGGGRRLVHSAGSFFVMTRADVEKVFPIPPALRIWYGDSWIWGVLEGMGRKAVTIESIRVVHAASMSSRRLPEFAEIVSEDRRAWEESVRFECQQRIEKLR